MGRGEASLNTASRGAVSLHLLGDRSASTGSPPAPRSASDGDEDRRDDPSKDAGSSTGIGDGGDPGRILATRWHFSSAQSKDDDDFRLYQATSPDAVRGTAKLVPESRPIRLAGIAGRGRPSAVGTTDDVPRSAKITSGIDFLRTFHPILDIPAALLAETIEQDAQSTSRDSLTTPGREDDNETLLVVPIALPQGTTELVLCSVGGPNFNELFLSTLVYGDGQQDESPRDAPRQPLLRLTPPPRPSLVLSSPIVQICASPHDSVTQGSSRHLGPWVAIRTCTEICIVALKRSSPEHGHPATYTVTVLDRFPGGSDGPVTYRDIRFDRDQRNRALVVDARGEIREWTVPLDEQRRPRWREAALRKHEMSGDALRNVEGKAEAAEPRDDFCRIATGTERGDLFMASASSLYRVRIEASDPPRAVRECFYTTRVGKDTLSRHRFTSLVSPGHRSELPLLAACTDTELLWFSMQDTTQPLFSVQHHRGPDRSLCLSALPSPDPTVARFVLSSKRNRLLTAYTIALAPREAATGFAGNTTTTTATFPSTKLLDGRPLLFRHHPMLVPTSLPSGEMPGSRPAVLDLSVLGDGTGRTWRRDAGLDYQLFEVTDRGAVFTRFLSCRSPVEDAEEDVAPGSDTLAFVTSSITDPVDEAELDRLEHPGPFGLVDTRIVDLRNVYRAAISDTLNRRLGSPGDRLDALVCKIKERLDRPPDPLHGRVTSTATVLASACRELDGRNTGSSASRHPPTSIHFLPDAPSWHDLEKHGSAKRQIDELLSRIDQDQDSFDLIPVLWQLCGLPAPSSGGADKLGREQLDDALQQMLVSRYGPASSTISASDAQHRRALERSSELARKQVMFDIGASARARLNRSDTTFDAGFWPVNEPNFERRSTNWAYADEEAFSQRYRSTQPAPPPPRGAPEVRFEVLDPRRPEPARRASKAAKLEKTEDERGKGSGEAEPDMAAFKTTSTTRLLLYEWDLGQPVSSYVYNDPYQNLMLPPDSRSRSQTPATSVPGTPSRSNTPRSVYATPRGGRMSSQRTAPPTIGLSSQSSVPPPIASRRMPPSIGSGGASLGSLGTPSRGRGPLFAREMMESKRHAVAEDSSQGASGSESQSQMAPSQSLPGQGRSQIQTQVEPGKFGGRIPAVGGSSTGDAKIKKAKKRARGF
ncbi:uncharacterized protein PSFLO_05958 [Pseudozyma flocculosa]|uniref:RNA polymerase I-specific transcription initiation factor RRN6-like protein n=1 Tax=Pseudozyma flocculosa TaxID=84751 RepID=A0A5C3F8S4_9BASI|nr:uncharacterized protein PSFLO_05958 [Pseudozyma flocculosa]